MSNDSPATGTAAGELSSSSETNPTVQHALAPVLRCPPNQRLTPASQSLYRVSHGETSLETFCSALGSLLI